MIESKLGVLTATVILGQVLGFATRGVGTNTDMTACDLDVLVANPLGNRGYAKDNRK